MMNLLIALISDTHERIKGQEERTDYAQLCGVLLELETLYRIPCSETHGHSSHIVFAEYAKVEADEWQGRVKATVLAVKDHLDKWS
jgi:hypothetical protein